MTKTSLITGITGQDGAYLAQLLLLKGYKVYGAVRRSASLNTWRLNELNIAQDVEFITCDLLEYANLQRLIEKSRPDEVYNLAAQSFVAASFELPLYTADVDGLGVMRLLEAVRTVNPAIRFYQASTSEMYGKVRATPQSEETPFHPRSPYGVAKLFAHWACVNYRESYNMPISSGILFNHESPLRGLEFVTRKITHAVANIVSGTQEHVELGNLDAKRDWGFAGDYVEGMWRMLQQPTGDDYVLATGKTYSVRSFVENAFLAADIELAWEGKDVHEKAINTKTGKTVVKINPAFYRPAEVDLLMGDATKAHNKLGWQSRTTFQDLVTMMVREDIRRVQDSGLIAHAA